MEETNNALLELCFIANQRNEINNRRMRALGRKAYYNNAVRAVRAHSGSSHELRRLQNRLKYCAEASPEARQIRGQIDIAKTNIAYAAKGNKCSSKWLEEGAHSLRMKALKAEAEYVTEKYKTMELTIGTRVKVATLSKTLNARVSYDNGYIGSISIQTSMSDYKHIHRNEIKRYAERFEAAKAVEKMLKD